MTSYAGNHVSSQLTKRGLSQNVTFCNASFRTGEYLLGLVRLGTRRTVRVSNHQFDYGVDVLRAAKTDTIGGRTCTRWSGLDNAMGQQLS